MGKGGGRETPVPIKQCHKPKQNKKENKEKNVKHTHKHTWNITQLENNENVFSVIHQGFKKNKQKEKNIRKNSNTMYTYFIISIEMHL